MNPDESARWKNEALDVVFAALASSRTLTGRIVFKGARVLSRRLRQVHRQSLDIDMNLSAAFVSQFPAREDQRRALETDIDTTLRRYIEAQSVVRYEIRAVSIKPKPQGDHPRGWNAFEARIGLMDRSNPNALALPSLVLDIAAPESLGPHAVAPLDVDGHPVAAYTLERIVGEKLRAFLSSLPAHRRKLGRVA